MFPSFSRGEAVGKFKMYCILLSLCSIFNKNIILFHFTFNSRLASTIMDTLNHLNPIQVIYYVFRITNFYLEMPRLELALGIKNSNNLYKSFYFIDAF